MNRYDTPLALAGIVGSFTAVVHGILMQRHMVEPVGALIQGDARLSAPIRKLVPPLLHFSTFNWLIGGLALIASAIWLARSAQLAIGLLVGSSYLFGAVMNCWATRGRHPGWMLMATALVLIAFGLIKPGG